MLNCTARHDTFAQIFGDFTHRDSESVLIHGRQAVGLDHLGELLVLDELICLLVELGSRIIDLGGVVVGLSVYKYPLYIFPEVFWVAQVLLLVSDC